MATMRERLEAGEFHNMHPSEMERVRRDVVLCAKELDVKHPGWAFLVNPITIDLQSATNCVVGQIYGSAGLCPYWMDLASRHRMAINMPVAKYQWQNEVADRVRYERPLVPDTVPPEWVPVKTTHKRQALTER